MKRLLTIALLVVPLLSHGTAQAGPSPNALRIEPVTFAPAIFKAAGVASNSVLQTAAVLPAIHSRTYDTMGRVSGYEELAAYRTIDIYYWPSIFHSSSQAKAAWNDAATVFTSRRSLLTNTCLPGVRVHCVVFVWFRRQATGGMHVIDYQVMRHNSCLLEVASTGTAAAWNAAKQQVRTILFNVDRVGAAVMQRACLGKLSFSFSSLQVLNTSGQAQTTFKVNQSFLLDVNWTVKNLTKQSTATIAFEYDRRAGSKWQKATSITETVPTTNGNNPYRKQSQVSAAGTYRITVTVTVKGTKPQSKSVTVSIT